MINHFSILRTRVAMENEESLKNYFTKNYLINGIDFDTNNHDIKSPFFSSKLENKYSKDESLSKDDNDLLESDEYDYDSDCSLGSMNSLYLCLKDDRTFQNSKGNIKQLQQRNTDFNKTDHISTNTMITRTRISKVGQFNDDIKDVKLVEKFYTISFYGKKKSITQNVHTKLSYGRQRKQLYMNSNKIKTTITKCKFKSKSAKSHKLRISLKNQSYKKHSTVQKKLGSKNIFQKNKNLLRYKLKEHIPLLQLKSKIKIETFQKSEKYSTTHKTFSELKQDFITDLKSIKNDDCSLEYCYIENQVSESNTFFIYEFMDSDDFDLTKVVDDIIKKLCNENDSITVDLI